MLSLSEVPVTMGRVKSLAPASKEDVKEMIEEAGNSGVADGWRAFEDS